MSSTVPVSQGTLLKYDAFNPVVRFSAYKREGRLLLKSLQRSLNDPEAVSTIQQVRDQVFQQSSPGSRTGKAVGFAGPAGGEGATSLSVLLALTLENVKRNRIAYLDVRMERKNFSIFTEMFALTKSPATYSAGAEVLHCYSAKNRNLSFLAPATNLDTISAFSGEDFVGLLGELRSAYDTIIFDLPAVLRSSETRMILPRLDIFYLVCAARRTLFSDVEKAKKTVAEAGGRISGVILNRQKAPFWTRFFGKDAFF